RRHTRFSRDWSSDVCSSDLNLQPCRVVRMSEGAGKGDRGFEDVGGLGRQVGSDHAVELAQFLFHAEPRGNLPCPVTEFVESILADRKSVEEGTSGVAGGGGQ